MKETPDLIPRGKRTAIIRRPPRYNLIVRLSDGAYFEASCPGYPDDTSMPHVHAWFFREIVREPDKWWRGERWRRTGIIWQTDDPGEWTPVEAIEYAFEA